MEAAVAWIGSGGARPEMGKTLRGRGSGTRGIQGLALGLQRGSRGCCGGREGAHGERDQQAEAVLGLAGAHGGGRWLPLGKREK